MIRAGQAAGGDKFIAGGQDGNHGAAVDGHRGQVHRRQKAQIGGAKPFGGEGLAKGEILSARTDVAGGVGVGADGDQVGAARHVFLDHDMGGTLRHRRAGEDAQGLTGGKGGGKSAAGCRLSYNVKGGTGQRGGGDGVAVHGRSVEGGLGQARGDGV